MPWLLQVQVRQLKLSGYQDKLLNVSCQTWFVWIKDINSYQSDQNRIMDTLQLLQRTDYCNIGPKKLDVSLKTEQKIFTEYTEKLQNCFQVEDVFWGWNNEVHIFDPAQTSWTRPHTCVSYSHVHVSSGLTFLLAQHINIGKSSQKCWAKLKY